MRAMVLALAVAACATSVRAEPLQDALRRFDGCWTGAFAGDGNLRDDRCFTRLNSGVQWQDVHTVAGTGYGGVTIYAWDAELRRIDVTYYASDGALMRGYAIAAADGLSIPDARYVGADGAVQHLRSRWRVLDEDHFEVISEREQGGVWSELMRITYARPTD
jgi:hypothetical protein